MKFVTVCTLNKSVIPSEVLITDYKVILKVYQTFGWIVIPKLNIYAFDEKEVA